MDALDRAQQQEEMERAIALSRHGSTTHLPSRKECADCGEPIPELRRRLGGVRFCVECQGFFEKRSRR